VDLLKRYEDIFTVHNGVTAASWCNLHTQILNIM